MLSLYKLEIFAAVVQEGSFSAAGERLYMSQPAVSQHIQDLENGLGTQLFRRGRRGVTLTPSGTTLYDYTQRILRLVAEAESTVTDVENLTSGQVRLGATPGVSVYLLPEWMQTFQQRFPRLTISLQTDVTSHILSHVLAQRLDIGFVEGELEQFDDPRLSRLPLRDIELFVVVGPSHPWWEAASVPIAALQDEAFIARPPNSQTRIWLDQVLAQNHVQPRIVAELDNPESIKQAVMSGMGITILPDYAFQAEVRNRWVHALPVENVALGRSLKLIWDNQTPFAPITRSFLQHLSEPFPQLQTITSV